MRSRQLAVFTGGIGPDLLDRKCVCPRCLFLVPSYDARCTRHPTSWHSSARDCGDLTSTQLDCAEIPERPPASNNELSAGR